VIDEVEVKGFMGIVVKVIKVVEFVRFPVAEKFEGFAVIEGMEIEVDILDKEAIALEDKFNVDFEEVDEILDMDEIDEDLEVGEVMVTVPKVPIPPGRNLVGEVVVIVEVFVDPRTRVW
jgi:hypothetical protein